MLLILEDHVSLDHFFAFAILFLSSSGTNDRN